MISTRILEAATEVLVLDTQLTRELGRHIVEKSARLAMAQYPEEAEGGQSLSAPGSDTQTFVHCIAKELRLRGVETEAVEAVVSDLNSLYLGLSQRTQQS